MKAWIQTAYADCNGHTIIGTDGSYKTKGKGVSAFVVQHGNAVLHTHHSPVSTHSSYDAEMKAANMAIEYVVQHVTNKVSEVKRVRHESA